MVFACSVVLTAVSVVACVGRAVMSVRDASLSTQEKGKKRKFTSFIKKHLIPRIVGDDWNYFPSWEEFAGPYACLSGEDYYAQVEEDKKNKQVSLSLSLDTC